jgi:hypothetical protein
VRKGEMSYRFRLKELGGIPGERGRR